MGLGNEVVKTYEIDGVVYDVYGCWDNDTPENEYDFYDIYVRETGECINLGFPFHYEDGLPTEKEIRDMLEDGI